MVAGFHGSGGVIRLVGTVMLLVSRDSAER
jgi:hypothetical protein